MLLLSRCFLYLKITSSQFHFYILSDRLKIDGISFFFLLSSILFLFQLLHCSHFCCTPIDFRFIRDRFFAIYSLASQPLLPQSSLVPNTPIQPNRARFFSSNVLYCDSMSFLFCSNSSLLFSFTFATLFISSTSLFFTFRANYSTVYSNNLYGFSGNRNFKSKQTHSIIGKKLIF